MHLARLLFPRFTLRQLGWMALFGAAGALAAGVYGIMHDQITYSMGPEYFTRFKFDQFNYLETEGPPRWVVAQIGFLATWWVGFIAAWFMARITIPSLPLRQAVRCSAAGVAVMMATALAAALVGWLAAPANAADPRLAHWQPMLNAFGVEDAEAFVRVGYIHNASYAGALLGLVFALIGLRRERSKPRKTELQ